MNNNIPTWLWGGSKVLKENENEDPELAMREDLGLYQFEIKEDGTMEF